MIYTGENNSGKTDNGEQMHRPGKSRGRSLWTITERTWPDHRNKTNTWRIKQTGETRGITKHSSDQNEKCLLDHRDLNSLCVFVSHFVIFHERRSEERRVGKECRS